MDLNILQTQNGPARPKLEIKRELRHVRRNAMRGELRRLLRI